MPADAPSPHALRVADLSQTAETSFALAPDADAMAGIAKELGLDGLRKLRLAGRVLVEGHEDWRLEAMLGATVTQPCSVTLAPVTTRIDVPVTRIYQRHYIEPETPEVEMPEDDTIEPLGRWIDPQAVMVEALSLAVPEYPRADGVALEETVLTEPGAEPLRDEDLKPFAGLAALKSQLEDGKDDDEG